MKKDIDKLMKKMKIDAIYAEGNASKDPIMYYLLNGANIFGWYIKKRGKLPQVIHLPIEREVAKNSGHRLINYLKYEPRKIYEKYRDKHKANALLVKTIFDDLKVKGTVSFYGGFPLADGYNYLRQIAKFNKNIKIHYGSGKGLLALARETKDDEEIKHIKKVRDGVIHAFNIMLKEVRQLKIKDGFIMKDKKHKLLLGDLRSILRRELFARKLIDSAGMIVAQGRDAAIPHNTGNDRSAVKLGKTIVFDIFPQEIGGGYFFDFTRTICFGHASKEIKELYHTVKCAQDQVFKILKVGRKMNEVEEELCKFFEGKGHRTFLTESKTQAGYCHSLGHGLGLNLHETPQFNLLKTNQDRVYPGMVFTVEPGLYYPDNGYGVRLEDVIYVNKNGRIVNLTNYPRNLVVTM